MEGMNAGWPQARPDGSARGWGARSGISPRRDSRLPRLHLLELEDLPWFPATIRDLATDYLRFAADRLRFERACVPLVAELLRSTGTRELIDLCSGGSGAAPALRRGLAAQGIEARLTLTDLYPNAPAFAAVAAEEEPGAVRPILEPIDARAVPRHLEGCRTLWNAFHHFRPDDARTILAGAVRDRQPLAIFEISDRRPLMIFGILLATPLVATLSSFLIRPWRWRRLFWSLVVPAVPFLCTWDGVVSQLRAYTVTELEALAREATAGRDDYVWSAGHLPVVDGPQRLTYLVGRPVGES
jgi:hypothetical protein